MSYNYNNQGGYGNQGFPGDNYGNQGGYGDNYNQGGYSDNYNQGGYAAPGQQSQGGELGGFTPDMFNEGESVNDMVAKMLNDPSMASSLPNIDGYQGSRDITAGQDFNMDEFEREFGGDAGERGLFSGFGGHGKSKTSHQLIGGAAAWAAYNWYENYQLNTHGKKPNHSFMKKLLSAFAAAQAIKFAEKKSSAFQGGVSRDIAIQNAVEYSERVADTKYMDVKDYTVGGGLAADYDRPDNGQEYGNQEYGNQGNYNQGNYNQGGYQGNYQGGYQGGY